MEGPGFPSSIFSAFKLWCFQDGGFKTLNLKISRMEGSAFLISIMMCFQDGGFPLLLPSSASASTSLLSFALRFDLRFLFTLRGFDGRMFLVVSCCPSTCPLLASFVPQLSDVTYIYISDISDKWYNLYLLHLSRTSAHRPGSRSSSLAATASSVQTNGSGTDWLQPSTEHEQVLSTDQRPRYRLITDKVLGKY